MKKIPMLISLLLLVCMLLTACAGTNKIDYATSSSTESTSPQATDSVPEATTAEPTPEVKLLPRPYIDVEFTENGEIYDEMNHVTCSLDDEKKGKVVNDEVSIDGEKYKIPHLYVKESGGTARLKYNDMNSNSELYSMLSDGFTLEAMVVNHNKLTTSSAEQCLAASCQSGGYNFSCYKGRYIFSVYAGGKYASVPYEQEIDTVNMTHLMGVYDPNSKTATLYVNGKKETVYTAEGMLGLASGEGWSNIILGGDTTAECGTHLLASNTRIADYKLYPSQMNDDQVLTSYQLMLAKFTGLDLAYNVEYYANIEEVLGSRLFATLEESYADVYEPKSGMVNSPSVIAYATKDAISSIAIKTIRPATLVLTVKNKGGVLYAYEKNGTEISTLYDAVKSLSGKIIPAFYVDNQSLCTLVSEFINYHNIGDCFIFSPNPEILKNIRTSTRSARPVLDISNKKEINVKDIKLTVSSCLAKAVILDSSLLTPELVTAFRAYSLSVYLKTESGKANIHDAVFKGPMGIVTENTTASAEAISVIQSFKETTLCFPTMIVAHRGDIQNCPENTLSSFISAAKSGADVIEFDVFHTKDNHLAINHDTKTTHWDKQLTCTESTRDELKALKSTSSKATADDFFTFYDEVLDYFSKNYTDVIFTVEIKDKRNAVIDRIIELTKQADMLDRIIIICMNHNIVRYTLQTYGVAVQMNKSYIQDKNNIKTTLAYACEEVTGLNSSFFTVWGDADYELNKMLRHRGIKYSPWTTTSALANDRDFSLGYPEFTTNTPHRCDNYARYLKAETDANGNVKVTRVNYDGSTSDVTKDAKLIVISGNVTFANGKISGSGTFAFSYSASVADYKYDLCSLSITK